MTLPQQYATHIQASTCSVTVASYSEPVATWARQYFGQWWHAAPEHPPYGRNLVEADIDPAGLAAITQDVLDYPHQQTTYANTPMLHRRTPGRAVLAAQPDDQLAYRYDRGAGLLRIVGDEQRTVALAAARLARETIRGQLLLDGWSILHASAVTNEHGETVLTFGPKGAGKTTVGLLLARQGWRLLANDRVFVKPAGDHVRVLPWPSAAAIGFGLLDALGLYDPVADRVKKGEELHPTQDQTVTDALMTGSRTPIRNAKGKELKPQFHPHQLADWLGLTLATEGRAARLLFPTVTPDTAPTVLDHTPTLTDADFFTAATEDRYPDTFDLLPVGASQDADRLTELLATLPHHALALSHDADANTALLTKAVAV
ncbi:hypothetical protein [Streptomyces sp. NBC_01431]|uniref:hypothetical protein n=1 Tax=Streptomyces sp. NBC_01431 TaxID=2903863 RepID=UPI002E31D7AE|nr:hypothetical protein [Streptomyces sp. NBC_01431]